MQEAELEGGRASSWAMDPDAVLLWAVCDTFGYGLNVNYPPQAFTQPAFPACDVNFKAKGRGEPVQLQ